MKNVILPLALQLVVDDVGWHNGADERYINMPARSGLPRFHHPDDVRALNAIGEGLGMKIVCSLVIGEWDKNNRLRGVPHVTNNEAGWDAAGKMKKKYTEEYFRALEESEYLDYSLHGLCHGYFENGKLISAAQYYPFILDENGKRVGFKWLPEEEFAGMVDLFLAIYNDWGFKKKIVTFVSPCGCRGTNTSEGNLAYSRVLRDRGMHYWCNSWRDHDVTADTINGLIITKGIGIIPWNAYDYDPDYIPIVGEGEFGGPTYGCHLTNFIRFHHEKNFEYVPKWINYFKKQAAVFGYMLSRDMAHTSSQAMYERFAKLTETDCGCTIDLTDVDAQGAIALAPELYISFRGGLEPATCEGGEISLYEEVGDHKTYRILRGDSKTVTITYKK